MDIFGARSAMGMGGARGQITFMTRPLPHERLVVYQKAVALYEPVRQLVAGIRPPHTHLADQALRSMSSVPLNIAEGATEFSRGDKARFYRMALRSAGEASAALDVLRRSKLVNVARCVEIRAEIGDVIAMLTGLVKSMGK
jgi:four helix bundle protein